MLCLKTYSVKRCSQSMCNLMNPAVVQPTEGSLYDSAPPLAFCCLNKQDFQGNRSQKIKGLDECPAAGLSVCTGNYQEAARDE